MKTLLKQSKLSEKLILNEDEDILLDDEENNVKSNISKENEVINNILFRYEEEDTSDEDVRNEMILDIIEELYPDLEAYTSDWDNVYRIYEEKLNCILDGKCESLKEAKVNYVKTDNYGKYGTEVKIYSCEGDEITPKGFTANVNGKTLNATTLDELEKNIINVVNSEDKKADDTILNDSLKEDIEEKDDLLELEEPIDEEPIEDEITEIEEPSEPITQEVADNAYLTQINDLITSEYGKIDEVKSIIATFDSEDAIEKNEEVISILNAFIDETTISIGMLTKASELIDSTTNDLMQQGIDKAEEVIKDIDKEENKEEE